LPAWLAIALIVAAALAMRLWALAYQSLVTVDGTEYIRAAESLARGRAFVSIFPPGYPALIAIARLAVEDRVLAAQVVSLAAGVLLPVVVWLLARRFAGAGWALAPALALALHPELARFSAVAMSESAFLLALFGGLLLAARGRALTAGLALGAAFAIRPEAIVTALVLGAIAAWRAARGRLSWRIAARGAAGFLALAIPCWIYFHATLGVWTLTPKVGAFQEAVRDWRQTEVKLAPQGPETAAEARARGTLETLARNGPDAVRQYPANAAAHARSLLALWPAPLLVLSLIGLALRRGIEAVPLIELLLLPLLGLSQQPRFVLPAVPALALLALVPLVRAAALSPSRARMVRAAGGALVFTGAVMCGVHWAGPFRIPLDGSFESNRLAGRWLSGVSEPADVVLDRKPYVAFYAGREYRVMPNEPYETLVRHAVATGVRWLVVDQKVAEIFRAQLEPLLYDAAFREREARLELAYVGGLKRGYGIGVFRVLKPGERKRGRPPVVEATYLSGGGTMFEKLRDRRPGDRDRGSRTRSSRRPT
jgi:hypothetical protein